MRFSKRPPFGANSGESLYPNAVLRPFSANSHPIRNGCRSMNNDGVPFFIGRIPLVSDGNPSQSGPAEDELLMNPMEIALRTAHRAPQSGADSFEVLFDDVFNQALPITADTLDSSYPLPFGGCCRRDYPTALGSGAESPVRCWVNRKTQGRYSLSTALINPVHHPNRFQWRPPRTSAYNPVMQGTVSHKKPHGNRNQRNRST
jgi:hypothetical protein